MTGVPSRALRTEPKFLYEDALLGLDLGCTVLLMLVLGFEL